MGMTECFHLVPAVRTNSYDGMDQLWYTYQFSKTVQLLCEGQDWDSVRSFNKTIVRPRVPMRPPFCAPPSCAAIWESSLINRHFASCAISTPMFWAAQSVLYSRRSTVTVKWQNLTAHGDVSSPPALWVLVIDSLSGLRWEFFSPHDAFLPPPLLTAFPRKYIRRMSEGGLRGWSAGLPY